MNEVQIFSFENNQVRVIEIEGEPWFVGNDVATVLGYSNTRDAIGKHVDSEDKNTVAIRDGITRGNPNKTIINESGLYSLILSSKLPSAKKFKRWVTSKVLPTIRKHGAYMTDQKAFDVVHNKNGKVYVRWENVSKYLSQHVGKGDWITEPQFYKLAFKASNIS